MPTPPVPPSPGRLGDPHSSLSTDPRSDPRMLAAMAPLRLGERTREPRVAPTDPLEERIALCRGVESRLESVFASLFADLPPIEGVSHSTREIRGDDGNDIRLTLHRPADAAGELPGVVHLHGGGMVMFHGGNAVYSRWRDELAATGLVVVGVEFRNAVGPDGLRPYPAGLDDATSAVRWVAAHRGDLGISRLILQGDSGGANLALATAIRAGRNGYAGVIDGVYASVPYISGLYEWHTADNPVELPSLTENDGYFMSNAINSILRGLYDVDRAERRNPLAWPYFASVDDLRGLPPHVISVNELDPCRDEGLAYARRLRAAGVAVTERTVHGVCHFGDELFRAAMPDVYAASVAHVRDFARGR